MRRSPMPYREQAGQAVHYITGAVLGGIYGVITEYRPEASARASAAPMASRPARCSTKSAVPAAGLAPGLEDTPLEVHAYGAASHLVYGIVLEGVRRLIAGKR
jgi:putative membrane protein